MKRTKMISLMLILVVSLGILAGCTAPIAKENTASEVAIQETGSLIVSVNPKIELTYDDKGMVKSINALNEDGKEIVAALKQTDALQARVAVVDIVKTIFEKGFLSVDDDDKHISLELKEGSILPDDAFLKSIVTDVQAFLREQQLENSLVVADDTNYGVSQYGQSNYETRMKDKATKVTITVTGEAQDDTDYDGVDTDYDDPNTDYDGVDTDYNDPNTDYDGVDTDYNDPNTDYDGVDTDYSDPNTDYDGVDTDYSDPASNYDDGGSNYSGGSDYDDSGYGDSGYDD